LILNFIKQLKPIIKKNTILIVSLLTLTFLSGLYAAGYNFNQFSSLAKQRYGDAAFALASNLNEIVIQNRNAQEIEKLVLINNFFNQQVDWGADIFVWGMKDYWASPLETIGRAAGDCEDFTIAKYVFLKILGIPNEKLRLTYVKAKINQGGRIVTQAHMVLSYYATPNATPLILDNLIPNIEPASRRPDLTPIFTFNDKGLWVGSSNKRKGSASSHLSRWRDLLVRINQDGLE
jgi:predicted transglutaminase-like cysteine proteinase